MPPTGAETPPPEPGGRPAGSRGWPTESGWRATVPELSERYRHRWDLRLGETYPGGSAGAVTRVTTAEGREAVLKLSLPHREARHEALALRWWDGEGAVRLLRHDPADPFAMLLERCEPGVPLAERSDLPAGERLRVAAGLLTRLWARPWPEPAPLETLADVTREWAELARRRAVDLRPGYDPGLVDLGTDLLRSLPAGAGRTVVVHGDFNPGNVLTATREPWLVIDPKPMLGDPGYDLCPLLMQVDDPFTHPDPAAVLRDRTALLADLTGEPAERLLAWSVARMVEAALWYASRSEVATGGQEMTRAAVLASLLPA